MHHSCDQHHQCHRCQDANTAQPGYGPILEFTLAIRRIDDACPLCGLAEDIGGNETEPDKCDGNENGHVCAWPLSRVALTHQCG